MFSDFPNLHPLVVHFPIVLILLSAVLQAVLLVRNYDQIRWGTLIIMAAAFLGAVLASYVFHAHTGDLKPAAAEVFERHERFAYYTVWLSGLTFLLQGVGIFYKLYQISFRTIVFVSALISAAFLSVAGHQGAQLVYVEGVGPQGRDLMKGHDHSHGSAEDHSKMNMDSAGMEGMNHENMNMDSGHEHSGMDDMDHSNMNTESDKNQSKMQGMDHRNMNMGPGKNQSDMQGMDHSNMNMGAGKKQPHVSGMDHSNMNMGSGKKQSNVSGMDHSNMNMGSGKKQENMQGMDHSNMNMRSDKKQQDIQGMDHGNMNMGTSDMQGMDHGAMVSQPLIDPNPPYDNNPAWEEKKVKQKQKNP